MNTEEIRGEVSLLDDKGKMLAPGYVRPNHPTIPVLKIRIETRDLRQVQIIFRGDVPGLIDRGDEISVQGREKGGVVHANRIFNITTNSWVTKKNGAFDCFIATAVYESPFSREVAMFRIVRDKYLLRNIFGQKFVDFYYEFSPAIATYLKKRPFLTKMTRIFFLQPIIMILNNNHLKNSERRANQ